MENDFRRIKLVQVLGKIPNDNFSKGIYEWGVKILFKLGMYNFIVNIPDKLLIQDFTTAKVVYEANLLLTDQENKFSLRSYLAKEPKFVPELNDESMEYWTKFFSSILDCKYDDTYNQLRRIAWLK